MNETVWATDMREMMMNGSDDIAVSAMRASSCRAGDADRCDGTADPFALYLKGKILLGRTAPASAESRLFEEARMLERRAASLMLRGRELESVAVNEELVRRFDGIAGAGHIVARARFNAGCAYARIGIVEKASEQFAAAGRGESTTQEYHRTLSLLIDEGIRQTEEMMNLIAAHRHRTQERRRALGWE